MRSDDRPLIDVPPFFATGRAIASWIDLLLSRTILLAGKLVSGPLPNLRIAAVATALALFLFFPDYPWILRHWDDPLPAAVYAKIQHPFTPIPASLKDRALYGDDASHNDKLDLRLTLPLLGWAAHTGQRSELIWSNLAGIGLFYLLARFAARITGDPTTSALFVLGLAATYFGSWAFNDSSFGDSVAFCFLLLAASSPGVAGAFISFLAAAFCDERSVTAAPLLFVLIFAAGGKDTRRSIIRCSTVAASLLAWWFLRLWLSSAFHLTMGTSMIATREIIRTNLRASLPGQFLQVFKASWSLPVIALLALVSSRQRIAAAALVGAFLVAILPAFLVTDFERSINYSFLALLVALPFLRGDPARSRPVLAAILVLNVVMISPLRTAVYAACASLFHF